MITLKSLRHNSVFQLPAARKVLTEKYSKEMAMIEFLFEVMDGCVIKLYKQKKRPTLYYFLKDGFVIFQIYKQEESFDRFEYNLIFKYNTVNFLFKRLFFKESDDFRFLENKIAGWFEFPDFGIAKGYLMSSSVIEKKFAKEKV